MQRARNAPSRRPTDGSCPNATDSRGAVLHSRLNFVAKFALQLVSDAKNAVTRQKRRAQFHHPVHLSHHTQGSHEIFITAGCIDCHARPGRLRKNHCCSSCHRTGGGRSWPGRARRALRVRRVRPATRAARWPFQALQVQPVPPARRVLQAMTVPRVRPRVRQVQPALLARRVTPAPPVPRATPVLRAKRATP